VGTATAAHAQRFARIAINVQTVAYAIAARIVVLFVTAVWTVEAIHALAAQSAVTLSANVVQVATITHALAAQSAVTLSANVAQIATTTHALAVQPVVMIHAHAQLPVAVATAAGLAVAAVAAHPQHLQQYCRTLTCRMYHLHDTTMHLWLDSRMEQ